MGNHKFRLFNMIPNTWLYKLRDMKRASKKSQRSPKTTAKRSNSQSHTPSSPSSSSSSSSSSPPPTPPKPPPPPPPPPPNNNTFYLPNRASYYFPSKDRKLTNPPTTHVPSVPPRKSKSKKKFSARKPTRSSPSSVPPSASDKPGPAPDPRPFDRDVYTEDDDRRRKATVAETLEPDTFSVTTSATDIVFDVGRPTTLPPILTKPTKRQSDRPRSDRRQRRSPSRVWVRPGSPRLSRSKAGARQRKGFMESFVVVKSSSDPRRDFQESMVEMIIENNIRSSKDLEELLACFLALNSREYHAVIVQVFEQIWIHLNDPTL